MLKACSHLVIATKDVERITQFFQDCFEIKPYFVHKEFSEFVLPNRFRLAFFNPVGPASKFFSAHTGRESAGFGLTVEDVDSFYARIEPKLSAWNARVSGPPKSHPWGEKSFLLVDFDENRWEITQTPSRDGMLVDRE